MTITAEMKFSDAATAWLDMRDTGTSHARYLKPRTIKPIAWKSKRSCASSAKCASASSRTKTSGNISDGAPMGYRRSNISAIPTMSTRRSASSRRSSPRRTSGISWLVDMNHSTLRLKSRGG